jgi:long-chain acyl-CoA synthetase
MIHPLLPAREIEFHLNTAKSRFALTLDAFYGKFKDAQGKTELRTLILCRIPDYLGLIKKIGFNLTKGWKIPPVPEDKLVAWWSDLMRASHPPAPKAKMGTDETAVILFSGGTTGVPKGIMLSNYNFISEGMQVSVWGSMGGGDSMLAILPIFHGFGLGVCINAVFMGGGKSILVPQFTPEIVADTLPRPVKERFEAVVKERGGNVQLLEGYGLTEAVTAIMATPLNQYREGSVGIPFPDMLAKIVKTGTTEEAPVGEEGEIYLHGPAVMLGYLDQPEETANTLRTHADGKIWLHTGDIGTMDADGFFYFKLRQKRMIKSSGMNVYPAQVEEVLYRHPDVKNVCVIGALDEKQVQRVKGFVVLKEPGKAGSEMKKTLIAHCQEHLIRWSCPREI